MLKLELAGETSAGRMMGAIGAGAVNTKGKSSERTKTI